MPAVTADAVRVDRRLYRGDPRVDVARAVELLDRVNEAGKRDILRGNNMMELGFSLDCPQKEWPDPSNSKDGLNKQIEARRRNYRAIRWASLGEMRFNGLIAGEPTV
jgi:hypothetical protein